MLIAHELGLRFRARSSRINDGEDHGSSKEDLILSGVLGLFALLMAFSFSMALSRLEVRRDLMLRETSAVGNLALMADAASTVHAAKVKAALQRYATARLVAIQQPEGARRDAALRDAVRLRQSLYLAVRETVRAETGKPGALSLATAYDQVEDSAVRRDVMTGAHLPDSVVGLLVIYSVISAGMIGKAMSGDRQRQRAAPLTLYVLVSLALGVMLDLDRPRSGTIVISQEPFAQVVRSLEVAGN